MGSPEYSLEIADTITNVGSQLPDVIELMSLRASVITATNPGSTQRLGIVGDWYSVLNNELDFTQRGVLLASLCPPLFTGKIFKLGELREKSENDLLKIQGIGLGRLAILKAFGDGSEATVPEGAMELGFLI